jgi:small subunit ribosomal protein S19
MNRVNWKGPYINNKLLKKTKDFRLFSINKIKTLSKNSTILPRFIGSTLWVYSGKNFTMIKIIDEMVGHKLGEFVSTRKKFSYKKNK